MKRKSTIEANYTVAQLLSALQIGGHLDNVQLPDWATGTSVDELFEAIRSLGDGEWLEGVYPNLGVYEAADQWIGDFLEGKEVAMIEDSEVVDDEEGDDAKDLGTEALVEYMRAMTAKARSSFLERLDDHSFRIAAAENLNSLTMYFALAALSDDKEYAEKQSQLLFMEPSALADKDLTVMSRYYILDNYEEAMAPLIEAFGSDRAMVVKRIKAMGAKLKKAISAAKA